MKNKNLLQYFFQIKGLSSGRISKRLIMFVSLAAVISVFFSACQKFEDTPAIYNKNIPAPTNVPTITSVQPAAKALGGVREIKINGQNLGVTANGDTVWVYIGGKRAKIKELAADHITIYRPQLDANKYDKQIYINVTDPKAVDTSASVPYEVESAGIFVQNYSFSTASYAAFDFDQNDNLYVLGDNRNLYYIDFSGAAAVPPTRLNALKPTPVKNTSDMKFGPGAAAKNLYFANGTVDIYVAPVADSLVSGFTAPKAITLPGAVSKIDFDQAGNLYAVGKGGMYFVKRNADNTYSDATACSGYEGGLNIKEIRVYNGYVYVGDSLHVWKSLISGDGTLGAKTELVNIQNSPEVSTLKMTSFALDQDGGLYLCIKGHPTYNIFVVEGDQSVKPYYNDSSILPGQLTERLIWGSSRYMYLTKGSIYLGDGTTTRKTGDNLNNRVYRMYMDKNGAPYYGRSFMK